jgi:hypothetical protein
VEIESNSPVVVWLKLEFRRVWRPFWSVWPNDDVLSLDFDRVTFARCRGNEIPDYKYNAGKK